MCKSVQEGGQRCASHTRARLARAQNGLHTAALSGDPQKVLTARNEWFTAASEYASTSEGHQKMGDLRASALATSDFEAEAMYGSVLAKGAQIREANEAAAAAIAARQGTPVAVAERPVAVGHRMTPVGGGASSPAPLTTADEAPGPAAPRYTAGDILGNGTQDEGRTQNAHWLYRNSDPRKITWTGPAGGLSREQVVEALKMASDPTAEGNLDRAYYNLRRLRTGIAKSKPAQFGAHRDEAVRRADMAMADLLDRPGVSPAVAEDALTWSTVTGNTVLRDRMLAHPALPGRTLATYQVPPGQAPISAEAWAGIQSRATRAASAGTFVYRNHPDPAARAQAAAGMASLPFADLDADEAQALRTWLASPSWSKVENGRVTATRSMTLASATGTSPDRELLAYASSTQPPRRVHVPAAGREPSPGAVTISPRMLAHAVAERQQVIEAINHAALSRLGHDPASGWRRDPQVPPGLKPATPSWMKHPHVQQALGLGPAPTSAPPVDRFAPEAAGSGGVSQSPQSPQRPNSQGRPRGGLGTAARAWIGSRASRR